MKKYSITKSDLAEAVKILEDNKNFIKSDFLLFLFPKEYDEAERLGVLPENARRLPDEKQLEELNNFLNRELKMSNVPDDWNDYYTECPDCGRQCHASEGCDCEVCEFCGVAHAEGVGCDCDEYLESVKEEETTIKMFTDWYILDSNKNPVPCADLEKMDAFLKDKKELWKIGKKKVGDFYVSTVFLRLDHNHSNQGAPILFETLVSSDKLKYGEHIHRYETWEQAELGHSIICDLLESIKDGEDDE